MHTFLTSTAKTALTITLTGVMLSLWSVSNAAPSAQSTPPSMEKTDTTNVDTMSKVDPNMAAENHNKWGIVLQKYAKLDADGLVRFDYGALKASPTDMENLTAYIETLSKQKPSTFERKQAMSYWANLYNAVTVLVVVENYPVSSILKIRSGLRPGPWKRKLVTVEGEKLSLDNIEHDIMRPTYKTPLVHYMVNCASIGCPNLKPTPWSVKNFDAELDVAARAYINSPRGVYVKDGKVTASKIYKWFKEDFGDNPVGVLNHAREYADPELLSALEGKTKIKSYKYDWKINN
ncbi:MAG: DUF547 domain-containing protein [Robiginitomaculum sp.]|nr:DUF547 domain-containing protein [Robiginitomaculum sp.]